MLATIWQQVLGSGPVGVHDNFFELGGHSLLIMRVVSLVHEAFSVDIAIRDLFDHPTIEELGKVLRIGSGKRVSVLRRIGHAERVPLSYGQERLWFIDRLQGSVQYHLPLVLRLKGELDEDGLDMRCREC